MTFPTNQLPATTPKAQEYDPEEPHYDVIALPDNQSASATNYHLGDILDRQPLVDAVIWETARPEINTHPILLTAPIPSDIKLDLHRYLSPVPGFEDANHAFWKWLNESATDKQLKTLLHEIKTKLPSSNGSVVTHSPVLTFCTCSHNNASPLGSLDQARSAMYYLIPYEGKDKFPLAHCLSILDHSLQHLQIHKSKHPSEAGTLLRTVKHMLERTVNQIHLHVELSDYQTAAALLELPSMIMSDQFAYGDPSSITAFDAAINHLSTDPPFIPTPNVRSKEDSATTTPRRQAFAALQKILQSNKNIQHTCDEATFSVHAEDATIDPANPIMESLSPDAPPATASDDFSKLGYIRKLTLNKKSINKATPEETLLVPQAAFYYYRSERLYDLNFYEFLACIEMQSEKPSSPQELKPNAHSQFLLHNDFVGRSDCYHIIRRKQCTPLLTGRKPHFPGKEPDVCNKKAHRSWSLCADEFAKYYLSLFRPDYPDSNLGYTWDHLCTWISDLQNDDSIMSQFRLMVLDNHIQGLNTNESISSMIKDYRSKQRRMWTELEKAKESLQKQAQKAERFCYNLYDPLAYGSNQKSLTLASLRSIRLQCKYDTQQAMQLCSSLGIKSEPGLDAHGQFKLSPPSSPAHTHFTRIRQSFLSSIKTDKIEQKIEDLKQWQPQDPPTGQNSLPSASPCRTHLQKAAVISNIRKKLTCKNNEQQLQLFDLYADHFLDRMGGAHLPQIVLLHGGPGMGKSFLRDAICDAATASGRHVFKTAFNAINAVEMGGGTSSTELSLRPEVHPHDSGQFCDGRIQELRMDGFNDKTLVVVEEVSNQAPWHLSRLHTLCQSVIESAPNYSFSHPTGHPFGGALVLLIGDLTQLGPVKAGPCITDSIMDVYGDDFTRRRISQARKKRTKKKSIVPSPDRDASKYIATTPYMIGTELFTYVRWFELTQQLRSEDPAHTRFVNDTYHGTPITLESIRTQGYDILSPADNNDPEWIGAPVLVATNRERHTLTHVRAVNFATHHNTVVIRWVNNFSDGSWEQKPSGFHLSLAMEDPCFHEYFVAGADAFLTENIQKGLGLVNARSVVFHSLKFDQLGEEYLKDCLRVSKPGDVITMPQAPLAVNVVLPLPSNLPSTTTSALKQLSLSPHASSHVVLPIYQYPCRFDSTLTTVYGGQHFHPSKVRMRRFFPIEPAFAITVHKSEGRTMSRVIIALSHHPIAACNFSHAQVHVAFSRVRKGSHIRLLLTGQTEVEQWDSLSYLAKLRPLPSINFFFDGFRQSVRKKRSRGDWRTTEWSAIEANRHYQLRHAIV